MTLLISHAQAVVARAANAVHFSVLVPGTRRKTRNRICRYLKTRYNRLVHVITKKRLVEFATRFPVSRDPLLKWYRIVSQTDFASFVAMRSVFRAADQVGKLTVFDIGGNKFRIIAAIHYNRHRIYIRHVLTHVQDDKGKWKEQ